MHDPAEAARSQSDRVGAGPDAVRRRAWGDLRLRIISAAVLAPIALVCIWFGATPWRVLLATLAVGLACEWVVLCGARLASPAGALVPAAVALAMALAVLGHEPTALALLAVGFCLAWAASGNRAVLAAGTLYVGLAGIALVWLRRDEAAGRDNVLLVILVVWATDIGAYVTGRIVGGPKLAPSISPAKTWSGAVGGLAAAMLVAIATAVLHPGSATSLATGDPVRAALVGLLLGLVSEAGDLLESAAKRHFGRKDSSHIIPGHGGLLDRLDGLLAAAPVAALLALVLGRGVYLWR